MDLIQFGLYVFYIVVGLLTIGYLLLRRRYQYWADRNVIHDPPKLLYGNLYEMGRSKPIREPVREFYEKYKHIAPFGGYYLFLRRAVVLFDLDLVKNVLIKDFSNFAHRGNYTNEKDDPLTGHLFNLDGPRWKNMRAKLTPTFTTGKMKFMFSTVVDVAQQFVEVLQRLIDGELDNGILSGTSNDIADGIEIRELLARFTTDVIGSCAFGLECNSLKDPNTQFRLMGKKAFKQRRHGSSVFAFIAAFPNIARKLHLKIVPEDISQFFMKVVRDTVEYREREKVDRKDFMNLLIELKNRNDTEGLTIEEIAAQCFVFFLAGFETSSSTMSFCLYELALNWDIQERARNEINEMLARYDGKFTYEGLNELKYLKQILHETMRLYSVAAFVQRKTIDDYQVPGTRYTIEKNVIVIVPVDAIHRDPEIYPNPDKFDPSRFEQSEVEKRHPMTWLPFGEGPRNCIGLRFGEMQSLIGLVMLLKNFKITPSTQTKVPMEFELKSFVLSAKDGIVLKLEKL